MNPNPLPGGWFTNWSAVQLCGARTRAGTACKKPAEVNAISGKRLRCHLHGSKATGPKCVSSRNRSWTRNLRHGRHSKVYRGAKRALRYKRRDLTAAIAQVTNADIIQADITQLERIWSEAIQGIDACESPVRLTKQDGAIIEVTLDNRRVQAAFIRIAQQALDLELQVALSTPSGCPGEDAV